MESEQELQRRFWSRVAPNYDRGVDRTIGPATRPMLRARLLREDRLGRVAEFGCGTGYHTGALAERADAVVATDLAPGMLDVARTNVRAANMTFQQEDVQQTSFADETFDTCFVGMVIHFTDPPRTLAEMRRVLRPGGRLLVINPDVTALRGFDLIRCRVRVIWVGITGWRVKPPKGFGRNMTSGQRLCELMRAAGFEGVEMETFKDPARSSYVPVEYIRAVRG